MIVNDNGSRDLCVQFDTSIATVCQYLVSQPSASMAAWSRLGMLSVTPFTPSDLIRLRATGNASNITSRYSPRLVILSRSERTSYSASLSRGQICSLQLGSGL